MMASAARARGHGMIDPITLQVLRHRLQAINDEQIQVTVRTSGSPTVYEAFDVNSSLLTPAGESLCIGHYVLVLSMSFDTTVRYIIERFSENPGIHEGDVFYTNDPWAGAGHQNDTVMVAPMFWDGEIVAWSGLSLHEMDVGGPLAGGYGALAKDIYGEAPLIPPVKIVERGVVRVDIEDAVLRNSRTPAFNALDMRGRLAAINRGRTRINEIIQRYGKEGFLEAQQAILDVAQQAFARRLRELPDGTWTQEGYLDYGRLYRLRLVATKAEDRLTLDFRDASKQAPAMVNSARCLTEGGIMASVLAQVCYDMPWAPAGFKRNLDILTTSGTLVDAVHPAGVGQGGTASASLALNLVSTALCKMFAASDKHRDEAQADWVPSTKRPVVAGLNRQGRPFAITLIDQAGGGGALSFRDGQDSVHRPGSPMMAMGNVEVYERLYPVLYLYRKHSIDTAGPGKFRGGRGTQVAITPHRNPKPIQLLNLAGCTAHTEARGLYGGYPGPAQPTFLLRGAHPLEDVASGSMPGDLADFHSRDRRTLKSREVVRVYRGDVYVSVQAGGAGYGDPLERDSASVLRDVGQGVCSAEMAREVYGVELGAEAMTVLEDETGVLRRRLRSLRLGHSAHGNGPSTLGGDEHALLAVGDAVIMSDGSAPAWSCQRCGHRLGPADQDFRIHARAQTVGIDEYCPWNRYAWVDMFELRQFACPGCGVLLDVQSRRKGDPTLYDAISVPAANLR